MNPWYVFSEVARLLPRFTTEWVGLRVEPETGHAYPLYPMNEWEVVEDGEPDMVAWFQHFEVLGWSVWGRVIGEPVSYEVYLLLVGEGVE